MCFVISGIPNDPGMHGFVLQVGDGVSVSCQPGPRKMFSNKCHKKKAGSDLISDPYNAELRAKLM